MGRGTPARGRAAHPQNCVGPKHPVSHNSAIRKRTSPSTTRRKTPLSSGPAISQATDERLGRIVRLLSNHATVTVSGTKIADEIGTSRSEVWRLVQQLRHLGVDIAGRPATGYQLERIPDLLLPEVLAPMLRGNTLGHRIQHFFRITSTNSAAAEAAVGGEPEGTVFLSEEQVSGRGRGRNTWHSPRSTGIYCSVVLRPPLVPADALLLSLVAGLAVVEAVQQVSTNQSDGKHSIHPDLRWPNDVLLNGKKFCGILIELTADQTRVRHAVVGIGINVNQPSFPEDLKQQATSLRLETGLVWSRVELVSALLKSLDLEYRKLKESPADARGAIFRRFEQHSSSARGRKVHVDENGGFEGVTEGLDEHGFLRVRTAQGMRTVLSGGVR